MDLQRALLVRRLEAYFDSWERLAELLSETIEEEETSLDDTQRLFELAAPVLDEMRALARAGVIDMSPESELALRTQYAGITAHGTTWHN
jgi:hypothetical protein